MTHPHPDSRNSPPTRKTWSGTLLVCLILYGLALIPRLSGASRESLWWDEYTSVVHLDAPSLAAFLRLNRTLDPATLPLYYTLEYLWWHNVSAGAFSLRVLSALLNAGTAPLLFLLARPLAGSTGGVVAALCFIFSPVHAQHGMGIRMYALFVPLAALSMWAWLENLREDPEIPVGRRKTALLVWAVATLLLSWTHPFAPLIPMVQGIHLFLARPRAVSLWLGRGLLMAALVFPSLTYTASVRFWPRETTEAWMRAPDPFQALADILWDDVPRWTWQIDWGPWGRSLDAAFGLPVTGAAAGLYAAAAVGITALFLIRLAWRTDPLERRFFTGLMLAWLVLPPVVLYGLSLAWRPCMMPRYTLHASLAMYLLGGMAVAGLAGRGGRLAASGLLAGLILCGLLSRPGPWRTDWRGPARLLAREARPEKDTFVVVNHTWRDVLLLNIRLDPEIPSWTLPTAAAETPEALRAVITWWQHRSRVADQPGGDSTLWILAAGPYFSDTPPEAIASVLRDTCGASRPYAAFPTVEPLWLWRVRGQATPPREAISDADPVPRDAAADLDHETMRALGDYALAQGLADRKEDALALLRALEARSAFAGELYASLKNALESGNADARQRAGQAIRRMWDSYGYVKNGREDLAREGFTEAARMDPGNGLACLEAGLLAAASCPEEAQDLLEHAAALRPDYGPVTRRLRESLGSRQPEAMHQILAATRAFREGLAALGRGDATGAVRHLRTTLDRDPAFTEALPPLAYALTLAGDTDAAEATLDACDRAGLGRDAGVLGNRVLLALMRGDWREAERWYREAVAVSPELAVRYDPLFQALFAGNGSIARAEAERLNREGIPVPPPILEIIEKLEKQTP